MKKKTLIISLGLFALMIIGALLIIPTEDYNILYGPYTLEVGCFYTPNESFCKKSYVSDPAREDILIIDYNVTNLDSYCGLYVKLDNLEVSKYNSMKISVKGDPNNGFPENFKIELKRNYQTIYTYMVPGVNTYWQEFSFPIKKDIGKIDEVVILFEHSSTMDNTGAIYIDDFTFSFSPPPIPPLLLIIVAIVVVIILFLPIIPLPPSPPDYELRIYQENKGDEIKFEVEFNDFKTVPICRSKIVPKGDVDYVNNIMFKLIQEAIARCNRKTLDYKGDIARYINHETLEDIGDSISEFVDGRVLDIIFRKIKRGYLRIITNSPIPWELVRYNGQVLFKKHILYLIFKTKSQIESQTGISYPIKILVLLGYDPPPYAQTETYYMDNFKKKKRIEVEIIDNMTFQNFKEKLEKEQYDIIHYIGHGDIVGTPDRYVPVIGLYDEVTGGKRTLAPSQIKEWNLRSPPKIVIFNACTTAIQRNINRYSEISGGFSQAFIEKGTNSFIGTLCPIRDEVALRFTKNFYNYILKRNLRISEALRKIKHKNYSIFPEIAGYILYSPNPNWRLIEKSRSFFNIIKNYFS